MPVDEMDEHQAIQNQSELLVLSRRSLNDANIISMYKNASPAAIWET
jgi:hypothetical protein